MRLRGLFLVWSERGTKYKINEAYLLGIVDNDDSNDARNDDSNDDSNGDSTFEIKVSRKSSELLKIEIVKASESYMSVEEIAKKVGKSISHLKNRVIPQMLQENLLERKFPDIPKHPQQKFRAVRK